MNRIVRLASGMVLAVSSAHAQPAPQPAPPANAPTPRLGASVIRPPTSVDPGMKVTPKPTPRLPTPVIHPPVQKGDTIIVPK